MLTNTIETTLHSELLPGERLLWSGQPRQGLVLRWYDIFLIPFSLLWGGGVLFGIGGALLSAHTGSGFFSVFFIPFAAVAFYITVGRFIFEAYQRRHTYYGLTNQRLLIVSTVWRRNVRALHLRTLSEMQISLEHSGRGTLSFGPSGHVLGTMAMYQPFGLRYGPAQFDGVEQPREVYQQIHAAQAGLLAGRD